MESLGKKKLVNAIGEDGFEDLKNVIYGLAGVAGDVNSDDQLYDDDGGMISRKDALMTGIMALTEVLGIEGDIYEDIIRQTEDK